MFKNFLETTTNAILHPTVVIPDTSPKKKLDSTDFGKVAATVLIGSALAGLTIAGGYIEQIDFGPYTALAVPILMGLWQMATKWLRDHSNGDLNG
jgi:hypothetical protein